MRDNLRRSRAIRDALAQGSPPSCQGNFARPLTPLAALLSGIVGSTSSPLPHMATKVPDGTNPQRRVKRLPRWLDNEHLLEEVYLLPYADVLLRPLALQTVGLVMDGSGVGRGGPALRRHVVDKGRALPLAWRVRHAPQGPCPADLHSAVVALRREVSPAGAQGGLRGDGECAGTARPATRNAAGWGDACRTAQSTVATWDGAPFRLDPLGACRTPGTRIAFPEVQCPRDAYGPVMVRSCWATG